MFRTIRALMIAAVLAGGILSTVPAQACPMCKVANEDGENDPGQKRAEGYMYSILFMLSMPATLVTVFGISFYRLSRKQALLNEEMLSGAGIDQL